MLTLIFILFAFAAVGGIVLFTYVLLEKNTPKALALAHGGIALLAILLLIIGAIYEKHLLWLCVAIFILVALGGIYVFLADIYGKKIRLPAMLHGVAAFIAILLLAIIIFV